MCGRKKQLTYWWLDRRERAKKRQGTRQPLKGNPGDLLTPLRLHFLTVTLAGHSSMDHSISEAGSLRFSCISVEPWLVSWALVCVLGGIVPSCNPNNSQHCYQLWYADLGCEFSQSLFLIQPLYHHCSMRVCWAPLRDNWVVLALTRTPASCPGMSLIPHVQTGDIHWKLHIMQFRNMQQIMLCTAIWDPLCRCPLRPDGLSPVVMASSPVDLRLFFFIHFTSLPNSHSWGVLPICMTCTRSSFLRLYFQRAQIKLMTDYLLNKCKVWNRTLELIVESLPPDSIWFSSSSSTWRIQ